MAKVFSLDDPADQPDFIRAAFLQSLLYGNVYLTRDGRDVVLWEQDDLEPVTR
jgi:hypothetical protein